MRIAALAIVLLATAATSPAIAQVAVDPVTMLRDGTLLEVSATGKTTRVPDIATIRAGVVTQSPTAAQALADNARRMARVIAALKGAGVADRDVQTANISLQPQYDNRDGRAPVITGYQASNTLSVRFRQVADSGRILDVLAKEGANSIDGPNFMIDKPEAANDEARIDAIRQARARAELYARAAGMRVDRIVTISEGGGYMPRPAPMLMARMAEGAAADTSVAPGEEDVTVTVNVRFLLK